MNDNACDFASSDSGECISVQEDEKEPLQIEEQYFRVEVEDKDEEFKNNLMIENPDSCMIFSGTKEMVKVLNRRLAKDCIQSVMIHGDMEQQERIRSIEKFRNGQVRFMIVTDVVARGIDFDSLSHVYNYDYPTGRETYVHRIGRTGRNGSKGRAISFITQADLSMVKQIGRAHV